MSFVCDYGQGWSVEKGCDGSTSNVSQPFELANHDFPISVVQLIEVVTAFKAHFLLVFFFSI